MRRQSGGFTLLELIIAMAIVGILAAIAVPSYQNYVRKAKRTAAQRVLLDIANRQERYFLDARTYATDLKLLNPVYLASPVYIDSDGREVAVTSNRRIYQISSAAPAGGTIATGYVLTATAQLAQVKDKGCTTLTLSHAGAKTPSTCW